MVWTYFAIAVNLFVCGVVAVPTQNDIAKSFQAAVHHQVFSDFVCFLLLVFDARRRNDEKFVPLSGPCRLSSFKSRSSTKENVTKRVLHQSNF
jgi:hypothetical protein